MNDPPGPLAARSLAEFFAVAFVAEAGVAAPWAVECPVAAAVVAILLAPYLANRLICRADLVCHMILKPVAPSLSPDNDDLFLWNPNGLVAFWTEIHAHGG